MVKRDSKVHRSHVLIGVMVVVIVGLIVFACTQRSGDSKTADLPKPAGSGSAIAGQGYSTGSYDHEYQLYNNWYQDGSVTSYLVENGNWVYLDTLDASGAQSNAVGSRVTYGDLTFKVLNHGVELDTPCDTYSVAFGSGKYGFASTRASLTMSVSSGAQPIQQITGSQDAVTIHNTFPGVGWFTLHCDNAAVAAPVPTPTMASGCINNTAMVNYTSTGIRTEINCQGGSSTGGYGPLGTCSNGQCVAPNCATGACASYCYDTDGGDNSGVAGSYGGYTSYGSYEGGSDTCRQAWEIVEHFCQNGLLTYGFRDCPTGTTCQSGTGACR